MVLEPPLYKQIARIAKTEGVSMSLKVRDLVRQALEEYEDACLAEIAEERAKTFHRPRASTHARVWAHLKKH